MPAKSRLYSVASAGKKRAVPTGRLPNSEYRKREHLTAAEIEAQGGRTVRVASDVCDRASLEAVLEKTLEAFGKVDILVNCAGKIMRAPTLDFPENSWNEVLETNLTGTLRSSQIFTK